MSNPLMDRLIDAALINTFLKFQYPLVTKSILLTTLFKGTVSSKINEHFLIIYLLTKLVNFVLLLNTQRDPEECWKKQPLKSMVVFPVQRITRCLLHQILYHLRFLTKIRHAVTAIDRLDAQALLVYLITFNVILFNESNVLRDKITLIMQNVFVSSIANISCSGHLHLHLQPGKNMNIAIDIDCTQLVCISGFISMSWL